MPGASILAVMDEEINQRSTEKIRRRTLRNASDPLSHSNAE